jgi:hypothetical protein
MVVSMWTRNAELQRALGTAASRAGAAALAAVVLAGDAFGQSGAAQAPVQQVDSAAGDRHALSTSLRVMSVDLSPHNFERVYQVPGRDDLMMRSNGALYAVFEQSDYMRDPKKKGAMKAVVPAATVFYIGRPDFSVIRSAGIRDLSFVQNDAPSPPVAKPLHSMPGVSRFPSDPVDGRAGPARGDARTDGRVSGAASGAAGSAAPVADAEPRHSDRSVPSRPPADVAPEDHSASEPPSAAPVRQEQPGFRARIDELMRRAAKPTSLK